PRQIVKPWKCPLRSPIVGTAVEVDRHVWTEEDYGRPCRAFAEQMTASWKGRGQVRLWKRCAHRLGQQDYARGEESNDHAEHDRPRPRKCPVSSTLGDH